MILSASRSRLPSGPGHYPHGNGSVGVGASQSTNRTTWDEQIVPTLRKRLENESLYLSNRISATTFDDPSSAASTHFYFNTNTGANASDQPSSSNFSSSSTSTSHTHAQSYSQVPYSPTFGPPPDTHTHELAYAGEQLQPPVHAHAPARTQPTAQTRAREAEPPVGRGGIGNQAIPRLRTKSGPLSSAHSTVTKFSHTNPAAGPSLANPTSSSTPTAPPITSPALAGRLPHPRNSPSSPATSTSTSPINILPPSRIPTRPRSKSQLTPRPPPLLSNPHPPPVPSSIPIRQTRSRSPQKRNITLPLPLLAPVSSGNSGSYTGKSGGSMSAAVSAHASGSGTGTGIEGRGRGGRGSPDLSLDGRTREGFIKNELPPFKMLPEEALRIAERGHELQDEDDWRAGGGSRDHDSPRASLSGDGERKRAITMKASEHDRAYAQGQGQGHIPRLASSLRPGASDMERGGSSGSERSTSNPNIDRVRRNSRPPTGGSAMSNKGYGYGISTSHTGLGLGMGMGHPNGNRFGPTSKGPQRSGSSRSPNPSTNGNNNGTFAAPRSASLNLLSLSPSMSSTPTQSRLGVAAHFIPPESSYTPPKGADWDEVVLPTVAKKLGMGENERPSPTINVDAAQGDEDVWAVEWDKDGTPVRWAKKKTRGLGESTASNASASPSPHDDTPTRTHAFSPTFEPSPDNPLHPRPRPPSLRYQRSNDIIELTPLRTSSGQTTSLGQPIAVDQTQGNHSHTPSPSPMSAGARNAYFPGQEPPPTLNKKQSGLMNGSNSVNGSSTSLGRKPSMLRKHQPTPTSVSRQASDMSLRNQYGGVHSRPNNQNGYVAPGGLDRPGDGGRGNQNAMVGGTPGTTHRITDAIYDGQFAKQGGGGKGPGGSGKSQKRDEEGTHGRGCGCVVM